MFTSFSAEASAERRSRLIRDAEHFRHAAGTRRQHGSGSARLAVRRLASALRTIGAVQNPSGPVRPYAQPLTEAPSMPTVAGSSGRAAVAQPAVGLPSVILPSGLGPTSFAPIRGWDDDAMLEGVHALLAVELEREAAPVAAASR